MKDLKTKLVSAKEEVLKTIRQEYQPKIKQMEEAYRNENFLTAKIEEAKIQEINWNSSVKELKRLVLSDGRAIMVLMTNDEEIYVIDENKISESTKDYIRSFNPLIIDTFLDINENEE